MEHVQTIFNPMYCISDRSVQESGGGPFGALIVKDGETIGKGCFSVYKYKTQR